MTWIEETILKRGPLLSGTLISEMQSQGISNEAIRKRISRVEPPLYKLSKYFKNRQSLIYHIDHINGREYYNGLISAFETAGKSYFAAIKALEYHQGYLRKDELANYLISPVGNLKKHKKAEVIIKDLIKLKVIQENEDYYSLNPLYSRSGDFKHFKGINIAKEVTIKQLYNWARSINLVSYDKGTFNSEYSGFQWAFVGPSYISTVLQFKEEKLNPGFIVSDILIIDMVEKSHIEFFIAKLEIIKRLNVPKVIPLLLVNKVSNEALQLLKEKGIIVGFIEKIFGPGYSQLLSSLIKVIEEAGKLLKSDPDKFIKLLDQINKFVDGGVNNLRGDLFELAVGYFYSSQCQVLEIGKKISHEGQITDIDVLVIKQDRLILAECKGYKSNISKQVIEDWITNKIPLFYKWVNSQSLLRGKKITFEFWSASEYTEDARKIFTERSDVLRKYEVKIYDRQEIIKMAKDFRITKFIEIMNNYFIKVPA
ncbi:hypothetical protein [Larkinella soli]|uniref:hypothetical protein n=1 Tax=Larkinella soli TaxID=1770527 RepID=UPI000FFB7B2C|nr:hypothetical protein [Larkinella soli]